MAESPEEVRPRHEVPSPTYRLTLIAFVTLALIGGGNGVAIRFSNRELPPFWGASLRFSVAAALFFAVVLIRHTVSVTLRRSGGLAHAHCAPIVACMRIAARRM